MQGRRHKNCRNDAAKQQVQTASPLLCLGTDVVNNVFYQLACTLEPGGVRGPSLVARDLAAAAQVCKEFRTAAQRGFEQLADLVYLQLQQQLGMPTCFNEKQQALFMELHNSRTQHVAPYLLPPTSACGPVSIVALALAFVEDRDSNESNSSSNAHNISTVTDRVRARIREDVSRLKQAWSFWDAILSSPASSSYEQLTEAALKLGMPLHHPLLHHADAEADVVQFTHAELLQSVLAVFGVTAATRVPAVVLAAIAREHMSKELVCDGEDACTHLHCVLKKLAELARDVFIPLGLKAQGWGYGQRRPPGWPKHAQVPDHQRGIAVRVKGGLAAVRAALAAAGIDNLQQLEELVATERRKVDQLTRQFTAQLGRTAADGAAAAAAGKQRHEIMQKQKFVSAVWKTEKKAAQQQKLAGQMGQFGQVLCSCGEVAAKHCARGSCAKCCIAAAIAAAAPAEGSTAASTCGSAALQQQVSCLRHKVCKGCGSMEAAQHCVRGCCAYCCGQAAAADGAAGPCIKH